MTYRALLIAFLAMSFSSCSVSDKEMTHQDYQRWIRSDDSGLTKSKRINGLIITAQFVPNDVAAYNEFKNDKSMPFDSLVKSYKCALRFNVEVTAEDNPSAIGNLLQFNIASQEEYNYRINYLNFSIAEFISLKHGETEYEPVIATFNGFDPTGHKLIFNTVFSVPEYNCGKPHAGFGTIDLVFIDPVWGTGLNHFEFPNDVVTDLPRLAIQ